MQMDKSAGFPEKETGEKHWNALIRCIGSTKQSVNNGYFAEGTFDAFRVLL